MNRMKLLKNDCEQNIGCEKNKRKIVKRSLSVVRICDRIMVTASSYGFTERKN